MALRKKTLRKLPPRARKVARLIGELESVANWLKNMLPDLVDMEMWESAGKTRARYTKLSPAEQLQELMGHKAEKEPEP